VQPLRHLGHFLVLFTASTMQLKQNMCLCTQHTQHRRRNMKSNMSARTKPESRRKAVLVLGRVRGAVTCETAPLLPALHGFHALSRQQVCAGATMVRAQQPPPCHANARTMHTCWTWGAACRCSSGLTAAQSCCLQLHCHHDARRDQPTLHAREQLCGAQLATLGAAAAWVVCAASSPKPYPQGVMPMLSGLMPSRHTRHLNIGSGDASRGGGAAAACCCCPWLPHVGITK
jgi:hypothetical protein